MNSTHFINKGIRTGKIFTETEYYKRYFHLMRQYHVGGMPLSVILSSRLLATYNCRHFSFWLSKVLSDSTLVSGDIESLKRIKKRPILQYEPDSEGYHVWIEKGNEVIDPKCFAIYDKNYFYKHQKPTGITTKIQSEYLEKVAPQTLKIENIYDKIRLLYLINIIEDFAIQDCQKSKNTMLTELNSLRKTIDDKSTAESFYNLFEIENRKDRNATGSAIKSLFFDDKYKTPLLDSQLVLYAFLQNTKKDLISNGFYEEELEK